MIDYSFLACFTCLLISALQLFEEDPRAKSYGNVGLFAFMLVAAGFALFQVSAVNARYDEFLQCFHELKTPVLSDLNTAATFFAMEKLQCKVLGIPVTYIVLWTYVTAAIAPLLVLNSGWLQDTARGGYV